MVIFFLGPIFVQGSTSVSLEIFRAWQIVCKKISKFL